MNASFPEVVSAVGPLPVNCVLDGELVVLDQDGKPVFRGKTT